jgi:hypothetical protein
MKPEEMSKAFEAAYQIENEFTGIIGTRPDLHALTVLASLDVDTKRAIVWADHDIVWLSYDPVTVARNINLVQIQELDHCGVVYDEATECFGIPT